MNGKLWTLEHVVMNFDAFVPPLRKGLAVFRPTLAKAVQCSPEQIFRRPCPLRRGRVTGNGSDVCEALYNLTTSIAA